MKKLVTNEIGNRMQEAGERLYSYRLERIDDGHELQKLLEAKLLEEVSEYLRTHDKKELYDIIRAVRAILGEDDAFGKGFVLTNE